MSDPAYINADTGYLVLTCSECEKPLLWLEGGVVLIDINRAVALHVCALTAPEETK